jgi:GNAT superfamily N-acetyltransferase
VALVRIRPRREADLPYLVRLVDEARRLDGWPPHLAGATRAFLAGSVPLAALVADETGPAVGHVVVQEHAAPEVTALASDALAVEEDALAVVARLFVDPAVRRRGIGRGLLRGALEAAAAAGRHPIVDVWTGLDGAVRLYESEGWARLGLVVSGFTSPCSEECLHSGNSIRSWVFAASDRDRP